MLLLQHIKPGKGHSVLELFIAIIIFSLLMVLLMAVFDTGLKSWNTIEMKSDVQQKSLLSIDLLRKDLMFSDKGTLQIGGEGHEYIIMESAIGEDREFSFNHANGSPQWQSYILYYTYPRDTIDRKKSIDLTAPQNKNIKKKLIRKIIKHSKREFARNLTDCWLYFNDIDAGSVTGEYLIGKPRLMSEHISEMIISDNNINSVQAIDIKLVMIKSILEDRLAYEKSFDSKLGVEKIVTKNTIFLKNSR
ncbi:MAG: hypothetical protein ABRQ37_14820 [Candidatus Eremiobacterota bacterium]